MAERYHADPVADGTVMRFLARVCHSMLGEGRSPCTQVYVSPVVWSNFAAETAYGTSAGTRCDLSGQLSFLSHFGYVPIVVNTSLAEHEGRAAREGVTCDEACTLDFEAVLLCL